MESLSRLFSPKSIAVVGGGDWCRSVIDQLKKFDYKGSLYIINKSKSIISECAYKILKKIFKELYKLFSVE